MMEDFENKTKGEWIVTPPVHGVDHHHHGGHVNAFDTDYHHGGHAHAFDKDNHHGNKDDDIYNTRTEQLSERRPSVYETIRTKWRRAVTNVLGEENTGVELVSVSGGEHINYGFENNEEGMHAFSTQPDNTPVDLGDNDLEVHSRHSSQTSYGYGATLHNVDEVHSRRSSQTSYGFGATDHMGMDELPLPSLAEEVIDEISEESDFDSDWCSVGQYEHFDRGTRDHVTTSTAIVSADHCFHPRPELHCHHVHDHCDGSRCREELRDCHARCADECAFLKEVREQHPIALAWRGELHSESTSKASAVSRTSHVQSSPRSIHADVFLEEIFDDILLRCTREKKPVSSPSPLGRTDVIIDKNTIEKPDPPSHKEDEEKDVTLHMKKGMRYLPYNDYKDWFKIMETDDVEGYERFFGRVKTSNERDQLLHTRFWYIETQHVISIKSRPTFPCAFEYPFIIACVSTSINIVKKMVKAGADVTVRDKYKCNFVHAMILAAFEFRELEPNYMAIYTEVMSGLDVTRKRQLLYEQDEDRFRPLELAAKRGLFGLFRLILDTKGVYLEEELVARQGLHDIVRYDFSEYEDHESRYRQLRHPLRMIHFLQTSHMKSFLDNNIQEFPAVKAWRTRKLRQFFPYVFVWFLLRFLFTTLIVYYVTVDFSTASSSEFRDDNANLPTLSYQMHILGLFLAVTSFFVILFDIVEFLIDMCDKDRRIVDRNMEEKVKYVTHTAFYRYSHFILCCLCVTLYFLTHFRVTKLVYLSCKALTLILALLSYLQIMELLPWITSFAISMQKMVVVFLHFICIHATVRLIFYLYLRSTGAKPAKANYDYFGGGMYGVFIMDRGGGLDFGVSAPFYLSFIHQIFYYISAIMMINLFIAIMADALIQTTEYKHIVTSLRRLQAVVILEQRGAKFCKPFCRGFPRGITPFKIQVTRTTMHLENIPQETTQ